MSQDEIFKEIHRIREEYSRSFNHDLQAIFADLQRQQAESGREFINLLRKPGLTSRWGRRSKDLGHDAENAPRHSA